jgi:hypothetical protein
MPSDVHERARYLIDEALIAGLSKADETWLCNHTRCCAGCAGYSAATADILRGLRSMSFEVDSGMSQRVKDKVVARVRLVAAEPNQPSRISDCARRVIRQCVVTPSRQLALTTTILAVLAAPSVYQAVRDRVHVTADDQLLLDNIGANLSREIPEVLEPLMQPLSSEMSYAHGADDSGRSR